MENMTGSWAGEFDVITGIVLKKGNTWTRFISGVWENMNLVLHWQDVLVHGDQQRRRSPTSEGPTDSRSAGYFKVAIKTVCDDVSCDSCVTHFSPAGVLGGPNNNHTSVWQQRWLHSCFAGNTFDFRRVVCLSELESFFKGLVSLFVHQCFVLLRCSSFFILLCFFWWLTLGDKVLRLTLSPQLTQIRICRRTGTLSEKRSHILVKGTQNVEGQMVFKAFRTLANINTN